MSGCGGPKSYPVRGTVTLDKKPLPGAFVSFVAEDDPEAPSLGTTDDQGRYVLEQGVDLPGARAGRYVVRITTFCEGNPEDEPPMPAVPEKVPARYNIRSDVVREVQPGENVFDFELTSQGEIVQPQPNP